MLKRFTIFNIRHDLPTKKTKTVTVAIKCRFIEGRFVGKYDIHYLHVSVRSCNFYTIDGRLRSGVLHVVYFRFNFVCFRGHFCRGWFVQFLIINLQNWPDKYGKLRLVYSSSSKLLSVLFLAFAIFFTTRFDSRSIKISSVFEANIYTHRTPIRSLIL